MKRDMAFRQLPDSERLLAGEIKDHATIDAMTSDLFNNLAACCEVIGDLKEAQQFYEESLALRKVHFLAFCYSIIQPLISYFTADLR